MIPSPICNVWSYLSLVRYDHNFHWWSMTPSSIGEVWSYLSFVMHDPYLSLVRYDHTFHLWGMSTPFIGEVLVRYDSTFHFWGMIQLSLVRYDPPPFFDEVWSYMYLSLERHEPTIIGEVWTYLWFPIAKVTKHRGWFHNQPINNGAMNHFVL